MNRNTLHAILAEPGKEPEILMLPTDGLQHEEALRDVLEGNYGAIEFFRSEEGISLFVLVNDLAVALGMKPNRRFPGKDSEQIIFGKAIFIAAYNGELPDREGTLDMPEEMCRMFIEQIKLKALGISVKYDNNDTKKPGWKFAEYELKGVPVRIAIGPRDLENGTAEVARRDTLEKQVVSIEGIELHIQKLLDFLTK